MNKRKFIIIFYIIITMVFGMIPRSYAASVKVTEENFKEAFQKCVKELLETENCEIKTDNNVMTIVIDGETYKFNYNLAENPTFTCTSNITKGMSYNEYKKETEQLSSIPMMAYIAVANIQGVAIKDSAVYFSMMMLSSELSGTSSDTDNYIIVEDVSEGTTITNEKSKIIYESEFGEHVMEYVDSQYGTKKIYEDENKTLKWTIEEDKTDTSCKLVSTIIINIEKDFSILNGVIESLTPYKDITENTADYTIRLKVGQECRLQSNEKITGHGISGADVCEFNNDNTIIKALKIGNAKGEIYLENEKKVSFYIIVEGNANNETLETIVVQIDVSKDSNLNDNSDSNNSDSNKQVSSNNIIDNKMDDTINNDVNNNLNNLIQAILKNSNDVEKYKKVLDIQKSGNYSNITQPSSKTMPRTGIEPNPLLIVTYVCLGSAATGIVILLITSKKKK